MTIDHPPTGRDITSHRLKWRVSFSSLLFTWIAYKDLEEIKLKNQKLMSKDSEFRVWDLYEISDDKFTENDSENESSDYEPPSIKLKDYLDLIFSNETLKRYD